MNQQHWPTVQIEIFLCIIQNYDLLVVLDEKAEEGHLSPGGNHKYSQNFTAIHLKVADIHSLDQSGDPTNLKSPDARAMTPAWLKSYHIQNGVQSCENNTKVVKTSLKRAEVWRRQTHRESETGWWNELGGQTVALLLNSHRFYDLSYRRRTTPPTPKTQTVFETTLKTFIHGVEWTLGWWDESDTHVYVCIGLTCVDARTNAEKHVCI